MTKPYKIQFVDRIIDPVHGFIDITQVEKEIIELPIFKRLQSIKQLSLTNWVFPGAEHTRYMHSLGVMHIADLMAVNLKDVKGRRKFNDKERQLLRLAGLLHDIGHYPLSHVTESVYKDKLYEDEGSIAEYNLRTLDDIVNDFGNKESVPEYMKSRSTSPMHHESMGARVIRTDKDIQEIIQKHCPFINIQDINDIIVGQVDRNKDIGAMVQIMHSELDADGIDYIMRDSTFSGTSYGAFELGMLLRNLVVGKYQGVDIVGVRPKGISIVDQYLVNKYFSYTQVIMNRHVSLFNEMVKLFSKSLIHLDKSKYPSAATLQKYVDVHCGNEDYLKFTDRAFWTELDQLDQTDLHKIEPEFVEKILYKLQHYQEFPRDKDGEFIITSDNSQYVLEELEKSPIYKRLINNPSDKMYIYSVRSFTSEMPEKEYKRLIKPTHNGTDTAAKFAKANVKRLQEGIAVFAPDEKKPHLLADDPRSLMSTLYKTKTYMLREYKLS